MSIKKYTFHFFMIFILLICTFATAKVKKSHPPDRGITHNNKGVSALYSGDYDRAIFEFKTALELSPNYVEALSNLGLAYKYKGRLTDAEDVLKKATLLDKKYAGSYNHLGAVYYDEGKYDDALAEFAKAVKYNSKLSDAYFNAGMTHVAMYRKDRSKNHLLDAVKSYQKATEINADHAFAHLELAKVYRELGDIENAIIRYKLALEIEPSLEQGWQSLADLYTKTGETLKAEQALNRAMALHPDNGASHLRLGLNALKDSNFKMAIKEFDEVIRQDPSNESAYFNIGFAYAKYADSLRVSGQASNANQALGQSDLAYQSALKLRPTYVEAAYNIGYNRESAGDTVGAITWYKKASAIDATFARAFFSAAALLQKYGDKTEAARYYCSFLKLKPKDLTAQMQLATDSVKALGGCPK